MQWNRSILTAMQCPLCQNHPTQDISPPAGRRELFYRCVACDLIFKNKNSYLNNAQEKERYDNHENHDTPEYRNFLSQIIDPVLPQLNHQMHGLDFGCGPNPLLAKILTEKGFLCESYDPIYWPEKGLLQNQYDFIFCSEVVEHFYQPHREWPLMLQLLKPDGFLTVMTQSPPNDFANWYYHRDPTHVGFYSAHTMKWIARRWQLELTSYPKGVWLFKMMKAFVG